MLKSAIGTESGDRPDIRQIVDRLTVDGQRWAQSEFELAGHELGDLKSRAVKAMAFLLLAFAGAFCALVVFSQAAIAFLTPYVDGMGVAALIVGTLLLVLVAVSVLVSRSAFAWETESIFFRWFAHQPDAGDRPG